MSVVIPRTATTTRKPIDEMVLFIYSKHGGKGRTEDE